MTICEDLGREGLKFRNDMMCGFEYLRIISYEGWGLENVARMPYH